MKQIILILVFVVSILGATDVTSCTSRSTVDNNITVEKVVETVVEKSSIANNATVNIVLYNITEFFKEHKVILGFVIILLLLVLYYSNKWGRVLTILVLLHIAYQLYGVKLGFPVVDLMYYGFAAWTVSILLRTFNKYFEKFENKILATRLNLMLHIFDILVLIITIILIVNSFHINNIEVVTTGIGVAIFFIIRKDLNNLKSFLIISWDNFLSIGDKIIVVDKEGRILSINKFTSILQTENGNLVKVPNSVLLEGVIVNKSKNKKHVQKEEKDGK